MIWMIAENCPFSEEEVKKAEVLNEGESLYVCLLQGLKELKSEFEDYRLDGREIYLLFQNSIRNSKLANNLNRLDTPSTVRNWKTINKLVTLAKEY